MTRDDSLAPGRCVLLVVDVQNTKSEHDGAVHNVRTYFGRLLDAGALEEHWTAASAS